MMIDEIARWFYFLLLLLLLLFFFLFFFNRDVSLLLPSLCVASFFLGSPTRSYIDGT